MLMMPDMSGLSSMVIRSLQREHGHGRPLPHVKFVDMPIMSTVEDTFLAARMMQEAGVSVIVILGGDGTHRAVVREIINGVRNGAPTTPIAGLPSGTNNAFPKFREPTILALAVGLYAMGRLDASQALSQNKVLEIAIDGTRRDVAIVDAVIANEHYVGARALWKTSSLESVYLAFADPLAIGLSAIGGLLYPVGRNEPFGLAVYLSDEPAKRRLCLRAPIAPGLVCDVGIAGWEAMAADQPFSVALPAGVVALDGERDLTFERGEHVKITLRENAFVTVDVERCMKCAASIGLFRN